MTQKPPTNEQFRAIRSFARITFAVSGPGTGKTFTIARRMQHLTSHCGIAPDRILAFTFSNKAAREMEDAVANLCPRARFPWLGTTHGICGRILEQEGYVFDICDSHQQWQIIDSVVKEIAPSGSIGAGDAEEYIAWRKTRANTVTMPPKQLEPDHLPLLQKAYHRYQQQLKKAQLKDFNDLISDAVTLLQESPGLRRRYRKKFSHILADELQDFAPLQVKLLRLLKGIKNNLFLVGDDDQSIYSWLGADPLLMKKLMEKYPEANVVRLQQNFRSTPQIMNAASAVIANNTHRIRKQIKAIRGNGYRIIIRPCDSTNQLAESIADRIAVFIDGQGYAPGKIAVLGRRRIAWRHVRRVLEECGIPCATDSSAHGQKASQTLLDYMRAATNPRNERAFATIINTPRRGIGDETLANIRRAAKRYECSLPKAIKRLVRDGKAHKRLKEFSAMFSKWRKLAKKPPTTLANAIIDAAGLDAAELRPLLECMGKYSGTKLFLDDYKPYSHRLPDALPDGVSLLTIHGAKGLEYDAVFVVGMEHGVLPDVRALNKPTALEEERRLMYVAMTRARDRLFLYYLKESAHFTKLRESSPSRFITEIPDEYKFYPSKQDRPDAPRVLPSDASVADYLAGDSVFHATYGYGKIISIAGSYARVKFSSVGMKKVEVFSIKNTRG